ncbi:MAG: site-specific DNA-methyltransferase, partial [Armatimonadota bacterium]
MLLRSNLILYGDNMEYLPALPSGAFRLIYIDPPFNTGKVQRRIRIRTTASENGTRIGFGDRKYMVQICESPAYHDDFEDYLAFLRPRLVEARRLLTPDGSLFVHLDYREVHYVKVLLDEIFGRECFLNEIIWAYDYGGRSKRRWPAKHDNILWYVKDPKKYVFNYQAIDRVPYLAPSLVGERKARRGKTPTDVWWMTIVPTSSK